MSAFESIWRCYYRESFKFYRHKHKVCICPFSLQAYLNIYAFLFFFFFSFFFEHWRYCIVYKLKVCCKLHAACSSAQLVQQHLLSSLQCITFCYFPQYSNIFHYYYNCHRISDLCHCSCRKIANHWSLTWGNHFLTRKLLKSNVYINCFS